MARNTTPEVFDENQGQLEGLTSVQTTEEVLMQEPELLANLLEMGDAKNNPENYRNVEIRRNGVLKLQFRLRNLSEDEMNTCNRRASKYAKQRGGVKQKIDTDVSLLRSLLIYTATVDEDRKKIWDNPKVKEKFNIIQGHEMVDIVLLGGEKEKILELIDEMNAYTTEAEDMAKN